MLRCGWKCNASSVSFAALATCMVTLYTTMEAANCIVRDL